MEEKAKAVRLFEKVTLLHSLEHTDGGVDRRTLRQLTADEADAAIAAAVLRDMREGRAVHHEQDVGDAADTTEGSAGQHEQEGGEGDIRSRLCTHGILLCECLDELCVVRWQEVWNAYQLRFAGSRNWQKKFGVEHRLARFSEVAMLLKCLSELNVTGRI